MLTELFGLFISSLGQDLETSTYEWEIAFAIFISIYGLVLFSLLIGNMQVIPLQLVTLSRKLFLS